MSTQWVQDEDGAWHLVKHPHVLDECSFVKSGDSFVHIATSEKLNASDVEEAKKRAFQKGQRIMVSRYLALAYAGTDLKY